MNLIAAIDLNRCIGKDNQLLYTIKKDFVRFRQLTSNKVVVMGRKTWDSLPKKPLPNRINVIITSNKNFKVDDKLTLVYHSPEIAEKELLKKFKSEDIFIIGGESIYRYFMRKCDKFFITQIYETANGNKFLPEIPFDENRWEINVGELDQENGIRFSFSEYICKDNSFKCSIPKKEFCSLIEKMKEEFDRKNKLADAFHEYDKNSFFYPVGIEDSVIDFLSRIMKDGEGWISYFIYELNFGEKYKKGSVMIDNKPYELRTPAQLYNLLLEERGQE